VKQFWILDASTTLSTGFGFSIGRSKNKKAFCLALGALLLGFSFQAGAQQTKKVPRIGLLRAESPPDPSAVAFRQGLRVRSLAIPALVISDPYVGAFRQGLRELGYMEGQNIDMAYRYTNGDDQLPELAAELVRLRVNVIVTSSTAATQAAKNATSTIPIVMAASSDPVGIGLVASLKRPGGNITGLSLMAPDLARKRLELLREVLPGVARVAFLASGRDLAGPLFVEEARDAAERFGMQIRPLMVGGPEEIEGAFSAMISERAGALIVQPTFITYYSEQSRRIVDLAAKNHLATVSDYKEFVDLGGLISYGPDRRENFRRAATYVDKILKGTKPADLPVEQPTKFELRINLKAAQQIGLTIPPNVLVRADKVIK
jgi:putative ABC transport system substrate-binding protein